MTEISVPQKSDILSMEDFKRVELLLEFGRRQTRPRKHSLYDVLCGVLYWLSDDRISLRKLPTEGYPQWRILHEYFVIWFYTPIEDTTVLDRVLKMLGKTKELETAYRKRRGYQDY